MDGSGTGANAKRSLRERFVLRVMSDDPVVRALPGFLLTLLFGTVLGLAVYYAPRSFQSTSPQGSQATIPVWAGYITLALISIIALLIAFEPHLRKWSLAKNRPGTRDKASPIFKPFGFFWSMIDFFFAEVLAAIAGATQDDWARRYLLAALWITFAFISGLFAPAPYGLILVLFVVLLIIGVTRRWSWIEADRSRYMVERRERVEAELVGFNEDLRDEALIGVIFIFFLSPLALYQVQQATCVSVCAFGFQDGFQMPTDPFEAAVYWIGFFGAELAKTVPFVDWSEVFNVSNASPIKPATPLGAQVVFIIRAGLDLLLLAAILQAVSVANQLKIQRDSYDAKELPVLDPFEEKIEFQRLSKIMKNSMFDRWDQDPILDLVSHYDGRRLMQLVSTHGVDVELKKVAAASLINKALRESSDVNPQSVEAFFTHFMSLSKSPESERWLVDMACMRKHSQIPGMTEKALDQAFDASLTWEVRARAMRYIGISGQAGEAVDQLFEVALSDSKLKLRADAILALSRTKPERAMEILSRVTASLEDLQAQSSSDFEAFATLGLAHKILLKTNPDLKFVNAFSLHEQILFNRGMKIEIEPFKKTEQSANVNTRDTDQMILVKPGDGNFPKLFEMGNVRAKGNYLPKRRVVEADTPFFIGRTPVTVAEWDAFRITYGREQIGLIKQHGYSESQVELWPALEISWYDAIRYCDWLSRITGFYYRLPTEAEWEYCCRAGSKATYAWGAKHPDKGNTNFQGIFGRPVSVFGESGSGSYTNRWSITQMHGNCFEWCQDGLNESVDQMPGRISDVPLVADFSRAIVRGGAWDDLPMFVASSYRGRNLRGLPLNVFGMRLVRDVL